MAEWRLFDKTAARQMSADEEGTRYWFWSPSRNEVALGSYVWRQGWNPDRVRVEGGDDAAFDGTWTHYMPFERPQPPTPGVPALPGRLPFDQWPQSARGAYEALEKHLEKGPSFPLALLAQIRVQLSAGVKTGDRSDEECPACGICGGWHLSTCTALTAGVPVAGKDQP